MALGKAKVRVLHNHSIVLIYSVQKKNKNASKVINIEIMVSFFLKKKNQIKSNLSMGVIVTVPVIRLVSLLVSRRHCRPMTKRDTTERWP